MRQTANPLPLLKYRIPDLQQYPYQASTLTIEKELAHFPRYTSYVFSYVTLGKKMTGQVNVPVGASAEARPVMVLLRGFVPVEQYTTGVGTRGAAAVFAEHGYVTIAPDFFGYGGSDPETSTSWEMRFQKPISVIELIKTIEAQPQITLPTNSSPIPLDPQKMGVWAHSNGGQIALTTAEILARPLPMTLWAPVTAPFPYSYLFFSDEESDEGRTMRVAAADFDRQYNAVDFSLTHHLSLLRGPLQIHQGMADEAIPFVWNKEFVDKILVENKTRAALATDSARIATQSVALEPIEVKYFQYPNADHNLQPDWNTAIQRDLEFFAQQL